MEYLISHAIWVRSFIRVDIEGIIMAEDVLLNAFIHVSTDGKEVLRAIFILSHLFYPCPVS